MTSRGGPNADSDRTPMSGVDMMWIVSDTRGTIGKGRADIVELELGLSNLAV